MLRLPLKQRRKHPCRSLQTAQAVEGVVRAHGAVPATVAVLAGVPHVGLSAEQLQALASGCVFKKLPCCHASC